MSSSLKPHFNSHTVGIFTNLGYSSLDAIYNQKIRYLNVKQLLIILSFDPDQYKRKDPTFAKYIILPISINYSGNQFIGFTAPQINMNDKDECVMHRFNMRNLVENIPIQISQTCDRDRSLLCLTHITFTLRTRKIEDKILVSYSIIPHSKEMEDGIESKDCILIRIHSTVFKEPEKNKINNFPNNFLRKLLVDHIDRCETLPFQLLENNFNIEGYHSEIKCENYTKNHIGCYQAMRGKTLRHGGALIQPESGIPLSILDCQWAIGHQIFLYLDKELQRDLIYTRQNAPHLLNKLRSCVKPDFNFSTQRIELQIPIQKEHDEIPYEFLSNLFPQLTITRYLPNQNRDKTSFGGLSTHFIVFDSTSAPPSRGNSFAGSIKYEVGIAIETVTRYLRLRVFRGSEKKCNQCNRLYFYNIYSSPKYAENIKFDFYKIPLFSFVYIRSKNPYDVLGLCCLLSSLDQIRIEIGFTDTIDVNASDTNSLCNSKFHLSIVSHQMANQDDNRNIIRERLLNGIDNHLNGYNAAKLIKSLSSNQIGNNLVSLAFLSCYGDTVGESFSHQFIDELINNQNLFQNLQLIIGTNRTIYSYEYFNFLLALLQTPSLVLDNTDSSKIDTGNNEMRYYQSIIKNDFSNFFDTNLRSMFRFYNLTKFSKLTLDPQFFIYPFDITSDEEIIILQRKTKNADPISYSISRLIEDRLIIINHGDKLYFKLPLINNFSKEIRVEFKNGFIHLVGNSTHKQNRDTFELTIEIKKPDKKSIPLNNIRIKFNHLPDTIWSSALLPLPHQIDLIFPSLR